MIWEQPLTQLRDILAHLYHTTADARRVVDDAGLPPERIEFIGSSSTVWHSILTEARKHQGKVETVLGVALTEFQDNETLKVAVQLYRKSYIRVDVTDTSIPAPFVLTVETPLADLSPFIAGPPITHPAHFFGRERHVKRILGLWEHLPLQNAAIIGPRRSGKTSLLFYLMSIATAPTAHLRPNQQRDLPALLDNLRWVYVDFQDPRLGTRHGLMGYLASCLGLPSTRTWQLGYFMEAVQNHLQSPTVILLDEIGVALNRYVELDDEFWEGIRSLATTQVNGKLGFVLASHVSPVELAHETNHSSPFFNIFHYIRNLDPLTELEARNLIANSPIEFDEEDVQWILRQSSRWPVLLEILCSERLVALTNMETDDLWKEEALEQIRAMPDLRRLYDVALHNVGNA